MAREAVGPDPAASGPGIRDDGDASGRLEAVRLQGLCLLASPDARAATRKVLRAGEVVRVVAEVGDWVEIAVRGNVRGYVQAGYLSGFSGPVPAPYRDRLAHVPRRPGAGDAVGSLVAVGASPGAAPSEPASAQDRDRADSPADSRPADSRPAEARADPRQPPRSGDAANASAPDIPAPVAAPDGPPPDPQGIERYLAGVLANMRRPAADPAGPGDCLDAAARAYYERKNRYSIEVFLSECKLVLYEKQPDGVRRPARIFMVATPASDVEPPQGWGVITQIEFEPWWRPTENMKRRARQKGRSLPDVMPPGAKNPMGPFKMHLSHGFAFRIHGNNDPKSIGKRVTNGCIRMRNDEGVELARILDVGTEVVFSEHAPPGLENRRPGP